MPHVSKRKLDKEALKQLDSALTWMFSGLRGKEVGLILRTLMTPTEKVMFGKRLGILYLLKEDKSEAVIAEALKTTQPTVSRIKLQNTLLPPKESAFIFRKLSRWKDFSTFKSAMQDLALFVLKTLSRGMAGRI